MTAKQPIPAVGYVRMSTDKQEESPKQQRDHIEKLAQREGCTVIRWYEDHGISGDATEKRKDFQRMVRDAEKLKDFRAILCWDYSRFGRFDSIEAGKWIDPLRKSRVKLITVSDGAIDWTTFMGRVMNTLYAEGKNQFLTDLSRGVLRGKVARARDGFVAAGGAPMGLERVVVNPTTGKRIRIKRGEKIVRPKGWPTVFDISECAAEVELVRWIFERFTTSQVSLRGLAAELNRRGHAGVRGGKWGPSYMRQILTNPAYCGDLLWNRKPRGKYFRYANGEMRAVDSLLDDHGGKLPAISNEEDVVVHRDAFPAIVSRRVWDKAQQRLEGRQGRKTQIRTSNYVLAGLLHCGNCEARMHGATRKKKLNSGKVKVYRTYQCLGPCSTRAKGCGYHHVHQDDVLTFVMRMLRERLIGPDVRNRLRAELTRQASGASTADLGQVKRLEAQIAELERKIAKGTENLLLAEADEIPAARKLLAKWRDQKAALVADLRQHRGPARGRKASAEAEVEAALAELERLEQGLESDDPAIVREVLSQTVERIELWFSTTPGSTGKNRYAFSRGIIALKSGFLAQDVCATK